MLTTVTSLTAPTRPLRIRIFVNVFFLCIRAKIYFFIYDFEIAQTLTAHISRNSIMYI